MFSMQDKVVRGFQGAHQLSCHAQVDGYFSTSYNGWGYQDIMGNSLDLQPNSSLY